MPHRCPNGAPGHPCTLFPEMGKGCPASHKRPQGSPAWEIPKLASFRLLGQLRIYPRRVHHKHVWYLGACVAQVLCDRDGLRMPAVRDTIRRKIGEVYKDMDVSLETFPDGEWRPSS